MRALSLIATALVALAPAVPGHADTVVRACEGWEANARNLMMPPEIAVQSFANGEVRAIGLDTSEPACCSAHLMVDFFVATEPFPLCALVSGPNGQGFSGLRMAEMTARYDPATGLTLTLPAGRYDGMGSVMAPLHVTINRATATVMAQHD
ncbi:hypothetical protein [Roseicyclus mahoneyensis]|uniref:Uncharacterized protein n=1 Tax=Roseicyclus mahoneyensis TaxID=164332 RepID=A0A316GIV9_9RHOB|nr:hypothetical protein [Roseicyclus mahoneyensis]PWK60153.1 hypothetical protein C7455_105137 [Roseicyclus mahoneyensis]